MKPRGAWLSLHLMPDLQQGEEHCSLRVERCKGSFCCHPPGDLREGHQTELPGAAGAGRRAGAHHGKSRAPHVRHMLGQEIHGVRALPDAIVALGVLCEINRQQLSVDF